MTDNSDKDETIQAKRRRQGASSGPQGTERAEEHHREPQSGSSGGGPSLPSFGKSGGTGTGSGGIKLPLWLIILLIVAYFLYNFFSGGTSGNQNGTGNQEYPTTAYGEVTEEPGGTINLAPTSTPSTIRKTSMPSAGSKTGQRWTVMIYQDADDQILEQDIYIDLNEIERVGSTDRVQIVSQIDRYKGAYSGDGNWTSTRRYHITHDNDLNHVNSELVTDLGEKDMADSNTLVDFITWAASTYPADKYVLILSDHGMGWPGGISDGDPAVQDSSSAPLASALEGDQLYLNELETALKTGLQSANIDKLEMIGMDACLMGQVEVLTALEPYARYAVLSEETEPALGWAYTSFLQTLTNNPDMDGAELSGSIVDSYIKDDQRIVDNQARSDFLRQGSGIFGSASQISAAALDQQIERSVTLTAVDLSGVPALIDSINSLAYAMQSDDENLIVKSRSYAPSFTNIFGKNTPSPYIDLGGFVKLLKKEGANAQSSQAADQILSNIQNMVIAEKHGNEMSGATGISIYFPNHTLYSSAVAGPQSYTVIAKHFAQSSLWDDFLAYFYNNINFDREPAQRVALPSSAPSRAPGMGQIEISPITRSGTTASPGNPVKLTAKIKGKNIGYIYFFVGMYDQSGNAIFKADTDYLESSKTQEIDGNYYPEWSTNQSFNLQLDWDPTVFQISDGETTTVALFTPQTYGASAEDAVYTVDGIYHYADGTSRTARLYFRNGVMEHMLGYTDDNETGGSHEIIPQAGDTFTILDKWLDLDSSGKVTQSSDQEGAVLTFGSEPFRWKEVYAAAGQYVVGFVVQDLDGNTQEVYTPVTVQ